MYENPLTQMKYEKKEEFIESLADSWRKLEGEKYAIELDIKKIQDLILELVGTGKSASNLSGLYQVVSVTNRFNVSYPSDRGEDHPLKKLLRDHPQIEDMIRLEYMEAGNKIEKLLEAYRDGKLGKEYHEVASQLDRVRTVKLGKPKIVIKDKKDKKIVIKDKNDE